MAYLRDCKWLGGIPPAYAANVEATLARRLFGGFDRMVCLEDVFEWFPKLLKRRQSNETDQKPLSGLCCR